MRAKRDNAAYLPQSFDDYPLIVSEVDGVAGERFADDVRLFESAGFEQVAFEDGVIDVKLGPVQRTELPGHAGWRRLEVTWVRPP